MNRLIYISLLLLLASCAAPTFKFVAEDDVNMHMFSKLSEMTNTAIDSIVSVQVYKAVLNEVLIERDAVGERQIVNEKTEKTLFSIPIAAKHYELFFFKIFSSDTNNMYCILLSTAFTSTEGADQYIGLGPGFFGTIAINQVDIWKKLQFEKECTCEKKYQPNSCVLVPDKKEPAANITLVIDREIDQFIENFRITELVQQASNKIAGAKPIVFNIQNIFKDHNALLFEYQKTIKKE